jgi:hypothetical protein
VGVVVVGVVVVVVVAQEVFYASPELRKSGSVCTDISEEDVGCIFGVDVLLKLQ